MQQFFISFISILILSTIHPFFPLNAHAKNTDPSDSITQLKTRQPNWRMQIIEVHAGGRPKVILFSAPTGNEMIETPVQLHEFDENGTLIQEADVITVNNTLIPHGPSIHYNSDGAIEKIAFYNKGKFQGPIRSYYPDGNIQTLTTMKEGVLSGPTESYYSNGQLALKMHYDEGKLQGPLEKYYLNGKKALLSNYVDHVLEGESFEWFETEELKSKKRYAKGLLQNFHGTPAVIIFYPDQKVQEIQYFKQNHPCGMHCKYYPTGEKSYELNYADGKKHGKESYLDTNGTIIGGGEFKYGQPLGSHFHYYADGTRKKEAHYDAEGTLLSPIKEFDSNGNLLSQKILVNHKEEGLYQEWNGAGALIKEFQYNDGEFSGLQQEFFPNGQQKRRVHYTKGQKNGKYEEWNASGQQLTEINFDQGVINGKYISFYPTGQKKTDAEYTSGNLQGPFQSWFESGQLKKNCLYKNGEKEGICQEWNADGELLLESHFKDNQPDGLFQQWYSANAPKMKANYRSGKLEGMFLTWHANGSLNEESHFINGLEEGTLKVYFPTEIPDSPPVVSKEMNYLHGKLHGSQKANHPSGNPKALIHYEQGLLNGSKTLWDDGGVILENSFYVQGNLHGKYFVEHPSCKKVIYHYKNGILDGLHQIFYPDHPFFGKIRAFEATYSNGELHGEAIEYNEAGTKIASVFYNAGKKEGASSLYAPDGHLHIVAEFKDNQQHGPAREYSPTGQLLKESLFRNDQRDGPEILYFENGRKSAINHYQAGVLHGVSQEWNPEGVLTFEAEYNNGKRHGKCNKYDHSGNPLLLQTFENDKVIKKQKF